MQRFDRRPTLPAGIEIDGLCTIKRPLWTGPTVELYAVCDDRSRDRVLAFSVGDVQPLRVAPERTDEREIPIGGSYSLLDLDDAVYLGEPGALVNCGDVGAAVRSLLSLITQAVHLKLSPYCVWIRRDGRVVAPIADSRQPEARELAALVYWSLAGIDIDQCTTIPRLAGFVREKLPRELEAIERCALAVAEDTLDSDSLAAAHEDVVGDPKGFSAVAGMQQLKRQLLVDVVDAVRSPDRYTKYGLTVPNGILMYGPPGCGKTYIAQRLGEELGVPFIELHPSSVGSPYIHQTSVLVRATFETAFSKAPAVLFIDEFEALVPRRAELGGLQQYKSEEVNEFLVHLNNASSRRVLVIGATNEPESVDPAVLRTGRMDKLIYVGPPDLDARVEMLDFYLKERFSGQVDTRSIARLLEGCTASDIKFVVDEAAREALRMDAPIATHALAAVASRTPRSVTPEDVDRYKRFTRRG